MSASRPLVALLAATVLVFALYTVALKPASSSGGGGGSQAGAYQSAIAKARAVQGVVNKAAARDGGTPAPASAPTSTTSSSPAHSAPAATHSPSTAATHSPSPKTTGAGAGQPASASSTHVNRASGASAAPAQPTVASLAAPGTVVGTLTPTPPTPPGMTAAQRFRTVQVALEQHKVLALLFYNPASADDRAVESEMSSIPTHGGAVVKLAVPLQELAAYSSLLSQLPVNYSPTLVLIDRHGQAQEISGFADSFEIDQRVTGLLGS